MIEAIITGAITLILGVGGGVITVNSKSSSRMDEIDKRIDLMELKFTEKYVPRQELASALQKMEDHMIRIENKLDQIVLRNG